MISHEIRTCGIALGALLHEVTEEQAAVIRLIKSSLMDTADMAAEMEGFFHVPGMADRYECPCKK